MKKVLGAAAIAAMVVAGSAASANAATVLDISSGTANFSGSHKSGTFTDYFTFVLSGDGTFDLSITNSVAKLSQIITKFSETITGPSFPSGISAIANTVTNPPGKQTAELAGGILAGAYTIAITGTYSSTGASYGGSLATSVSSVPLPGSVAMFGAAVVALGAAGALRRKGSKSAALVG